MNLTYRLTTDDVASLIRDHILEVTAPLGDVDIEVQCFDSEGQRVELPGLVAEVTSDPEVTSEEHALIVEALKAHGR